MKLTKTKLKQIIKEELQALEKKSSEISDEELVKTLQDNAQDGWLDLGSIGIVAKLQELFSVTEAEALKLNERIISMGATQRGILK